MIIQRDPKAVLNLLRRRGKAQDRNEGCGIEARRLTPAASPLLVPGEQNPA
jgi:hypothetical protein